MSLKYYFGPLPDPNFQYTKATLAAGLLLIIAGIALSMYRKKYMKDTIAKKIIKKYPSLLNTYGALVIILLLIRETGIPYLSMRLWWFILLACFLYSVIKILFTYKKKYKKRRIQANTNIRAKKYMPKRKK